MNLEAIAYANTLSINARFNAFENFYWGYINATETKENAVSFRKMFLEFYVFQLQQQLDALPATPALGIKEFLQNEQKETQRQIALLV